jgi:ATP-binding cassette subfamily F protein uup
MRRRRRREKWTSCASKTAKLESSLDKLDPYMSDPAKFGRAGAVLAEVEVELCRAEEEWLELEIRREGI